MIPAVLAGDPRCRGARRRHCTAPEPPSGCSCRPGAVPKSQ